MNFQFEEIYSNKIDVFFYDKLEDLYTIQYRFYFNKLLNKCILHWHFLNDEAKCAHGKGVHIKYLSDFNNFFELIDELENINQFPKKQVTNEERYQDLKQHIDYLQIYTWREMKNYNIESSFYFKVIESNDFNKKSWCEKLVKKYIVKAFKEKLFDSVEFIKE